MGAKRHLNGGTQEGTYIHTDGQTQTDGHRNSMTVSAQWADSVKMASASSYEVFPFHNCNWLI